MLLWVLKQDTTTPSFTLYLMQHLFHLHNSLITHPHTPYSHPSLFALSLSLCFLSTVSHITTHVSQHLYCLLTSFFLCKIELMTHLENLVNWSLSITLILCLLTHLISLSSCMYSACFSETIFFFIYYNAESSPTISTHKYCLWNDVAERCSEKSSFNQIMFCIGMIFIIIKYSIITFLYRSGLGSRYKTNKHRSPHISPSQGI